MFFFDSICFCFYRNDDTRTTQYTSIILFQRSSNVILFKRYQYQAINSPNKSYILLSVYNTTLRDLTLVRSGTTPQRMPEKWGRHGKIDVKVRAFMVRCNNKISEFKWKRSCFVASYFCLNPYFHRKPITCLRLKIGNVAHYVIFLLLVEIQVAYLRKSGKKNIFETITFNFGISLCSKKRTFGFILCTQLTFAVF